MERDAILTLVRRLTLPVVEMFAPGGVEDFDDAFAPWSLGAGTLVAEEESYSLPPPGRGLDTTLVAGMFFR